MTEATYDNFEDDYAQAAELGRQKRIDQLKDEVVQKKEEKKKKSIKDRASGILKKIDKTKKAEKKDGLKSFVSSGAKMATGAGLRWSWYYLLPSWGLTIITLNLFAFLGLILHHAFPRVGEEWKVINPFMHRVIEKMVFLLINAIIIILMFMLFQLFMSGSSEPVDMTIDNQPIVAP